MSANANVVAIANYLISKSFDLESRYCEALDNLEGQQKWELATEVSRLVQGQMEKIAYAADIQKRIIDKWGDEDFEEMEADRSNLELDLAYSTILIPLSEVHEKSEKRKANAVERLITLSGNDVITGNNTTGNKTNTTPKDNANKTSPASGSSSKSPAPKSSSKSPTLHTSSKSPAVGSSSKSPAPESSLKSPTPHTSSKSSTLGSSSKSPTPHTSSKSSTPILRKKVHKNKEPNSLVEVVFQVDIHEVVEEIKRGLVEDEDKNDVIVVEQAIKGLVNREGKVSIEIIKRRLQRLMNMIKAEIREVEDSDMGDFEDENMVQDEEDFEDM
ncbi:hypothetical protein BGX38DRAFT_1275485 [Terfezia claveryi]|nr:hypothetical protein BGX38DRAFT_1275485 [Terfezia claveryi]